MLRLPELRSVALVQVVTSCLPGRPAHQVITDGML